MEIWRDIIGYEGVYRVSNFGRVKRVKSSNGTVSGKVLKPGVNKNAVRNVNLCYKSRPKSHTVHRLVALAFLGNPPTERHIVAHNDGNPSNNRLANLRWATPAENSFDQVKHGTQKGKYHGRKSALTDEQVISIRMDQRTQVEVAKDFGISPATVGQIRRRETYKYIPETEGDYESTSRIIRFTDDEIRAIRGDTRKNIEIACEIGCSYMTIWSIKTKRSYKHVPDEPQGFVESEVTDKEQQPLNKIQVVGDVAMIELTQNRTAIFDAEFLPVIETMRWGAMRGKYTSYATARNRLDDGTVKTIFMHRLLTNPSEDMVVDHINGDGLDNKMSNLRVVTAAQNNLNSRVRSDSQSKIKGAYYDKRKDLYYSRITVDGKNIYLGTFGTATEAAQAYTDASSKYHGEYGRAR